MTLIERIKELPISSPYTCFAGAEVRKPLLDEIIAALEAGERDKAEVERLSNQIADLKLKIQMRDTVSDTKIEDLEGVLRGLASFLGVGGYNADVVIPDKFDAKIRDGIDMHIKIASKSFSQISALKSQLADAAEYQRKDVMKILELEQKLAEAEQLRTGAEMEASQLREDRAGTEWKIGDLEQKLAQSEVANAQMRSLLVRLKAIGEGASFQGSIYPLLKEECESVLSIDEGNGWLSPEDADKLRSKVQILEAELAQYKEQSTIPVLIYDKEQWIQRAKEHNERADKAEADAAALRRALDGPEDGCTRADTLRKLASHLDDGNLNWSPKMEMGDELELEWILRLREIASQFDEAMSTGAGRSILAELEQAKKEFDETYTEWHHRNNPPDSNRPVLGWLKPENLLTGKPYHAIVQFDGEWYLGDGYANRGRCFTLGLWCELPIPYEN